MARRPTIPADLKHGPFTLDEARRAGVTRDQLRTSGWRRLSHGIYTWAHSESRPETMLSAAACRLPPEAVFSGRTAGWLHGLDVAPCDPIEVTVPPDSAVSARAGLRVRQARLDVGDVEAVRGWRATTITRTLLDLAHGLSLVESVVVVDEALRLDLTRLPALERFAAASTGRAGVVHLRKAVALAEPATESQMESRLRMVLVLGGLPRPEVQTTIHDSALNFVARADLYYPEARLVIEYDGETHRDSLADDDRRQNRLISTGHRLLRYTAGDVYNQPDRIRAEVLAALNPRFRGIVPLDLHRPARFPGNGR